MWVWFLLAESHVAIVLTISLIDIFFAKTIHVVLPHHVSIRPNSFRLHQKDFGFRMRQIRDKNGE